MRKFIILAVLTSVGIGLTSVSPVVAQDSYLSMQQIKSVELAANNVILDGLQGAIDQVKAAQAAGQRSFNMRYHCPKMGDAVAAIAANSVAMSTKGAQALKMSARKARMYEAVSIDTANAKVAIVSSGGILDKATMPILERTIKLSDDVKHEDIIAPLLECLTNYKTRAKLFQ